MGVQPRYRCRFCLGTGSVTVELDGEEKEVSRCINCNNTTCQGSGIQPWYLDRREFKDDDRVWPMIFDDLQRLGNGEYYEGNHQLQERISVTNSFTV